MVWNEQGNTVDSSFRAAVVRDMNELRMKVADLQRGLYQLRGQQENCSGVKQGSGSQQQREEAREESLIEDVGHWMRGGRGKRMVVCRRVRAVVFGSLGIPAFCTSEARMQLEVGSAFSSLF